MSAISAPTCLPSAAHSTTPHLILGGARSGKSRLAETLAAAQSRPVRYLATATASDNEMAERIAHHRRKRPATWETREVPYRLSDAIAESEQAGCATLVDCLTLWCSNWLLWVREGWVPEGAAPPATGVSAAERERLWREEKQALLTLCARLADEPAAPPLWLVANEVGLGIVPAEPLARRFRDEAGRLNQQLAAVVPAVTFVVAGLPWSLKGAAALAATTF